MRLSYSFEDVEYILSHYQELRCGIDPDPQPVECGARVTSRYHAPGIILIEWAGEIGARVKLCGIDGLVVELRYGMHTGAPMTEAEIERTRHIPLYEIGRRINRVKWFCVGQKRKRESYEAWRSRTRSFHHYRAGYNGTKGVS